METITIQQAVEQTGLTAKQIRDRINSGAISAVKDMSGGKQGVWRINPNSIKPEEPKPPPASVDQPRNLKDLKTAGEIKKIQQQLESGRERIRKEFEGECTAEAFEILNQVCRIIKKLNLTEKQQKVWNGAIDKIEKAHGK